METPDLITAVFIIISSSIVVLGADTAELGTHVEHQDYQPETIHIVMDGNSWIGVQTSRRLDMCILELKMRRDRVEDQQRRLDNIKERIGY